jgi:hypothetical protein
MSDTPRTSEEWRRIQRRPDGRYGSEITYKDLAHGMSNFAKQLERELTAVTEQRDTLAEELKEAQDAIEMMLNDSACRRIAAYTKKQLAAVKGGSDE